MGKFIQGVILLTCGVLFLSFGVVAIMVAYNAHKEINIFKMAAICSVEDIREGKIIKFKGKSVLPPETIISPFSHTNCCWYELVYSRGSRSAGGRGGSNLIMRSYKTESKPECLFIDNTGGLLKIPLEGANIKTKLFNRYFWKRGTETWRKLKEKEKYWYTSGDELREESIIENDENVVVLGIVKNFSAPLNIKEGLLEMVVEEPAKLLDVNSRKTIKENFKAFLRQTIKGRAAFIITTKSEKDFIKDQGIFFILCYILGAIFAGVGFLMMIVPIKRPKERGYND